MRKFKHKKTGHIATELLTQPLDLYAIEGPRGTIPFAYIKDSNDWEEITESKKDYEILSVKGSNGQIIDELLGYYINNPCCEIHSVKRLSDGVVFTIGDKVLDRGATIVNFYFIQHLLYAKLSDPTACGLKYLKHAKKPLFTTEDSKEMYEGDKYWTLRTKDNDWLFEDSVCRNISYFYGSDKDYSKKTGIYYFSTKEAAEEYIIMNKPCLSIKDIFKDNSYYENEVYKAISVDKLKELVKSKL